MSLRLFWHVMSMEARTSLSYRVSFWATVLVGLVTGFAIPYFLWNSIFEVRGVDRIAGFTFHAMILYYVVAALLSKVVRGSDMGLGLSSEIYQGTLTRYLVFPTQVVTFKYAQQLGGMLPLLVQVAGFSAIFTWCLTLPPDLQISLEGTLRALVSVFLAHLLYYCISIPIMAVAFWADNVWSLAVLLRFVSGFLGGGMLPIDLFPGGVKHIVMLLPFRHLFHVPVQTFLGRIEPAAWSVDACICLGWCAFFAVVAHVIWKSGERRYTGVGI